jgi:hypothetical protein
MDKTKIEKNEEKFVQILRRSETYRDFQENYLSTKIKREEQALDLLKSNKGKYTQDILKKVFDTIDIFETNKRWFGQLLATPNRNLIFQSPMDKINEWFDTILFSDRDVYSILEYSLKEKKLKGASYGLVSLLLYLKNPESFNICLPKLQEGLQIIGRLDTYTSGDFAKYYDRYNREIHAFKNKYKFQSREMDWIFTLIASKLQVEEDHFLINEDFITQESVESEEGLEGKEFAYEKDLRNFLAKNLNIIEPGLTLYEEGDIVGIEYSAGGRYIDILTLDKDNNFVVIELKVSRGYDRVVGQILRYMGWIENNLVKPGQKVRGVIIANDISEDLKLATSKIQDVSLYEYDLSIILKKIE